MSNAETSALGRRRARLVRWLGWDRNPLRRPADRIEAALRLAVLILILTAVPAVTVIAGRTADHLFLRTAQSQQAADHRVDAVLTQAAPADVIDPYVAVETTWAPARWTAPDGSARSGQVLAVAGAPKGSTVPIWVSSSGAVTDRPPGTMTSPPRLPSPWRSRTSY